MYKSSFEEETTPKPPNAQRAGGISQNMKQVGDLICSIKKANKEIEKAFMTRWSVSTILAPFENFRRAKAPHKSRAQKGAEKSR